MKTMDIKEFLKPIERLDANNLQATFHKMAEDLCTNFCIQCNGKQYYFAEIEFYYFKEGVWAYNWNTATYPRKFEGKGGQLFYHLSGVDVCFDGNLEKGKNGGLSGNGGGILIRSIVDSSVNSENQLIVGPLTCANTLLNACDGKCMPSVQPLNEIHNFKTTQTYRFFGAEDFSKIKEGTNRDGELKLAFYDGNFKQTDWNRARSSYYKTRFKYDNN